MVRVRLLPAVLAASALWLAPGASRAHGIQSSLERFGGLSAQLESSFSSGVPASDAEVRLMPPGGGAPISLGHTDSQGRLRFRLPAQASPDWEIQVDAGPGHRDYLEVPAAGGGAAASVRSSEGPLAAARSQTLAFAAVGLSGLLGGLWMRRPRA